MSNAVVLHDQAIDELAHALLERARAMAGKARLIVGIAGVPGAGKSTLAARLREAVDAAGEPGEPGVAVVASMDGFHRTNAALRSAGLVERKGSPETFDAAAYVALLRRCRAAAHVERVPVYDRTLHEPGFSDEPGHVVTRRTRVVIAEGNYLLLDRPPWTALAEVLDETWWLDVPAARAKRWIMQRHLRTGRSREQAERKYRLDRENAALVLSASRRADRVLCWPT